MAQVNSALWQRDSSFILSYMVRGIPEQYAYLPKFQSFLLEQHFTTFTHTTLSSQNSYLSPWGWAKGRFEWQLCAKCGITTPLRSLRLCCRVRLFLFCLFSFIFSYRMNFLPEAYLSPKPILLDSFKDFLTTAMEIV